MITTIFLVNINHLIQIQKEKEKDYFLVMRTLRIYFLNKNVQHC